MAHVSVSLFARSFAHRDPHLFPYTTLFRSQWAYEKKGATPARLDHDLATCRSESLDPSVYGLTAEQRVDRTRSEEHTSELQSLTNLVCRLLLEKKNATPYEPAQALVSTHSP